LINPGDEYWAIGGQRKLYFCGRYCLRNYFVNQLMRKRKKQERRYLAEKDYERMAENHIDWLLKMNWCIRGRL